MKNRTKQNKTTRKTKTKSLFQSHKEGDILGEASVQIRNTFRISEIHIRKLFRISRRTFSGLGAILNSYDIRICFGFLKSMFRISRFG